jgi:N-dimethylarginine dimethylaminohydrolase
MNEYASLSQSCQPRFLMCRPQYFAVTYSINPWMDPRAWAGSGKALHATAARQWAGLHRTLLARGASIEGIEPEPGLPDLVFTANAAVVLNRKAVLARFFHPERQCEQPVFAAKFRTLMAHGVLDEVVEMPEGVALEGAGDCIWDRCRSLFWMGCGFRSEAAASYVIEEQFGVRCLPLTLADPRFYHLDTAFCALPCGDVLYYPSAFTTAALDIIHEHVAPTQRILLNRVDATRFAANAVCFDRALVLSSCSDALRRALEERGYTVAKSPLHTFLPSGGSACCLTLRLDHQTKPEQASFVGSAHGDKFQSTAALPAGAISNASSDESRPGANARASRPG